MQLTTPDSEGIFARNLLLCVIFSLDSDISFDKSFAIVNSRLKKEKETNKRLEEKLQS